MAQWARQYSGLTHQTKVQDIENSLRLAIKTFHLTSESERPAKLKIVSRLAERLLSARLKALRAKMSRINWPGTDIRTTHLLKCEQELQAKGVNGILVEFGF